tara:strand:+ start:317 stop:553 length:237 start_codon:yes stop_codon:yes gene_type:complete
MSQTTLIKCFAESLGISESSVTDDLEYNSIPQWDSVGHMSLVAGLEDAFDVMLDTDDIIDMNSVLKAKEILIKNGVGF